MITLKSPAEIERMRKSSAIVVEALDLALSLIRPGIHTEEIDRSVAELIHSRGGRPAFKGYGGYPANICISVDDEVVHGIPGARRLQEGEIVSVDIGVEFEGYYGDAARTWGVGEIDPDNTRLLRITRESLELGIAQAREGNRLGDISHAIQKHVESAGYSVVRDLVGHGIGRALHESPQIPNFGAAGQGARLKAGMVFAIEPMVNMKGYQVKTLEDQWTVVTADGSPSAHFEHDVVITKSEPEILTNESGDYGKRSRDKN